MANGRVQTQGVGSAPKLQAVVNAGGQYRVQTQQAGRNKLMDLAESLSQVNPILQNYGAIQDIDAEMYEDDLKRLSPEDLKKKLSQSEATLDREVRKGNIPFLGSPLNWKRKKRALGKAAHDVFYNQLIAADGRLRNPIEGDDDKNTADIVNEEMAEFIENNPGLQGQFQNEGFQESINPTITRLAAQFDGEKARQARVEIGVQTVNEFVREAKNVNHLNSAQYDLDMERLKDTWQDMNGFAPTQQRAAISSVVKSLARVDELKARAFLNWAKTNIKVGNTLYGKHEAHAIELEQLIDDVAEQEDKADRVNRLERLEASESEFILALNAIQNTGEAEYNGQMYNDVNVLLKGFQETVAGDADPIYAAQAQKNAESAVKGDVDVDEYAKSKVRQKSNLVGNVFNIVKQTAEGSTIEKPELRKDPRFLSLQLESARKMNAAVNDKLQEMVRTGQTQNPDAAGTELDNFIRELIDKERPILEDRILKLNETAEKEKDQASDARSELEGTVTEAMTENVVFDESDDDVLMKLSHNLKVRTNKGSTEEELKAVLAYEQKYSEKGMTRFSEIASPNSIKHTPTEAEVEFFGTRSPLGRPIPFTVEERRNARVNYFKLARLRDEFLSLEVLKNKITEHGLRFEYGEDVNSNNTVFTTPEQIENAVKVTQSDPTKVPQDVRKIAKLIGEGSDDKILRFIRNQDNIHKLLNR